MGRQLGLRAGKPSCPCGFRQRGLCERLLSGACGLRKRMLVEYMKVLDEGP